MSLPVLTKSELQQFVDFQRDVIAYIAQKKQEHPLGKKLVTSEQPIPPQLSESLAVHLLQKGTILPELSPYSFERRKKPDIFASTSTGATITIEVKANGVRGFQRLTPSDVEADYLVWFQFDDFFHGADKKTFIVHTLFQPRRFFPKEGYMPLKKFLSTAGEAVQHTEVTPYI